MPIAESPNTAASGCSAKIPLKNTTHAEMGMIRHTGADVVLMI